ncbi:hypothetical protein BKA56DRAFT_622899 [Ilyonectria sp. MPI-CAGE-AT-0026]|nr:hypothetical protein BKA56DRAFT_622899 [Ilyonectria sp. MPI-CAGE-AT-0026]
MAGLLLLVCFGLLMLGLATAGADGPPLQGRSIAECDSNCGQSNPSPTASNAYLTRHCLLGTWCCPPAYRCGYVDMAGGWSCFENTSYSQSASTEAPTTVSMEIPTTATAHNLASTSLGPSDAPVSTHPSSAILSTATVASTTASNETTSETNGSPRSNTSTEMFSLSSSKTLTRLALATVLLGRLVSSVTTDDVFRVKEGTEKGGCDAYKADLALWFDDSIKLADIATAGIAATDRHASIWTASSALGQAVTRRLFLFSLAEFRKCSAVSRSDLVVNHGSFATVPGTKSKREIQCSKMLMGVLRRTERLWSMNMNQRMSKPGDYCTLRKKKSDPLNQGATQDLTQPNTVTLCINNFPIVIAL